MTNLKQQIETANSPCIFKFNSKFGEKLRERERERERWYLLEEVCKTKVQKTDHDWNTEYNEPQISKTIS